MQRLAEDYDPLVNVDLTHLRTYDMQRFGWAICWIKSGDRPGYGHRHPKDVADKFAELLRIVNAVNDLGEEAARMLSEELLAQRVVPIRGYPPAASSGPSDLSEALRDNSAALRRMLEESCRVLQELQSTASGLDRAVALALKDSTDAPTLTRQAVIECSPWGGTPGKYHLRIFHPPGRLPVVVIGDLVDNPSASITNAMEGIARAVSKEFLGGISPDRIVWIRYYPAERFFDFNDGGPTSDPTRLDFAPPFERVVFRDRSYDNLTWEPLDDEEIEELVGGPVREWHTRDYLSIRLQDEGAPYITIHPSAGRHSG
jgi:hypothetical protein